MMTPERIEDIKRTHRAWVSKDGVSNGQWLDSRVILDLIAEIDELRGLVDQSPESDSGYCIVKRKGSSSATIAEELLIDYEKVKRDRNDYKSLLEELNSRIFPGSVDTADSLVQMKKERDQLKAENEKLVNLLNISSKRVAKLEKAMSISINRAQVVADTYIVSPLHEALAQDDEMEEEGMSCPRCLCKDCGTITADDAKFLRDINKRNKEMTKSYADQMSDKSSKNGRSYADICLERAEKATEGPWEINHKHGQVWAPKSQLFISTQVKMTDDEYDDEAIFIAHARTDVPELARRLKKACEKLREVHAELESSEGYVEHDGSHAELADELEAPLGEK